MTDDVLPAAPQHRDLSDEERQALFDEAFELERKIKEAMRGLHASAWEVAEHLYKLHEGGGSRLLGYETLQEFLAQPDLGMSRGHFFRQTKLWRDLVVVKQIEPSKLADLEPSKLDEIRPSIMRGEVKPDDAIDDAQSLSFRDIRTKYRPEERAKHGQSPDDSTTIDADAEPIHIQCDKCGSWYTPDPQ